MVTALKTTSYGSASNFLTLRCAASRVFRIVRRSSIYSLTIKMKMAKRPRPLRSSYHPSRLRKRTKTLTILPLPTITLSLPQKPKTRTIKPLKPIKRASKTRMSRRSVKRWELLAPRQKSREPRQWLMPVWRRRALLQGPSLARSQR